MSKLTIVMYHYVRDLKNSRYPKIKGLDISLFKEQLLFIKKNYTFVTMEKVISCIEGKENLPDKSILLTFDDAYMDHYNNVFPVLDKYNIQGCFYAPVKAITEHVVLDVNKIQFVLASSENIENIVIETENLIKKYKSEYNLNNFEYYYSKLALDSRYDRKEVVFIKRLLQFELVEELRARMVDCLFRKYVGIPEDVFSRELYMNEDQLSHMLRSGMHIGNHGYNHYWWNQLSSIEMNRELDLSTNFLRKIGVDMDNCTACYPYGSYDYQSIKMLGDKGYKLAMTTDVNIAQVTQSSRFTMSRLDTNDLPKSGNATPNDWYEEA